MAFPFAQKRLVLAVIGCMLALLFAVGGCSTLTKKDKTTPPSPEGKTAKGVPARYYDFGDVLIPQELKIQKKSSFIYQTGGFSAGVLVLKGRIESNSLISFFENNMIKDNWKLIGSLKSERTMLLFQKENRWCAINIVDQALTTQVEIWVAPTLDQPQTGLLK